MVVEIILRDTATSASLDGADLIRRC
jgi:hypothetical protein